VECFADGGDDWIAPAEFAGEAAGIGNSAAGTGAVGRGISNSKSSHSDRKSRTETKLKNIRAQSVANKFSELDFYDDKLVSISIRLAPTDKKKTDVNFRFEDDGTNKPKTLSLSDCANIRFSMDFDTMADNWYAQTDRLSATADLQKLTKLVRAHVRHWRVQYMPPSSKTKPIDKKLSGIQNYVLFKIAFKGGTVELLAKSYRIRYGR
jgi:hypothetical protein